MKAKLVLASLLFPAVACACGDNEYEKCYSFCLVPRPFGGCAQEVKDCKCLPTISGPVGQLGEAGKKAVNHATKEVQNLGQDTLTIIRKASGDTITTLDKAGGDSVATLERAGGDIVNTYVKVGKDATATYVKAWKDTSDQAKRSFRDTVDAATAVTNYSTNQIKSYESTVSNAGKRLRQGKVIDTMWGLAIEPMQAAEANFARATQESTLIATAASSAAAIYGGPGGAAAYAAWATYRTTGNADQALRAGFLAAATAQAGHAVSAMPSGTMGEVLKKAAMAGAAGGIAVAASGGDEQAIKDGFLKSAGAVLVQAGNDKAKAFAPKAKDAWDTVQCISARDVDCISRTTWARDATGKIVNDADGKPRFDMSKLDPRLYIGKWSNFDPKSAEGIKNALMAKVSQLPKVEAIPMMKNRWILSWTTGKAPTIGYGQPTVVLTYVGPHQPFTSKVSYGRGKGTPTSVKRRSASVVTGNYNCTLAGRVNAVRVFRKGRGCEAIYRRDGGTQDVLWHSDRHPEICAGKAANFVARMQVKGMHCTAS
ncbi:hypothetical protein WS97_00360 [Burkholderia territorii]|uniref:hypothetical protein n=1 Tax=Burkholderia territorii TaxID=1503055 RepID=UPI00075B59F5|nr:hypothetical protein [Burkholderia territorii]KVL25411.1 hypothetical protein WS97_00360 [Burkholderia territorii]